MLLDLCIFLNNLKEDFDNRKELFSVEQDVNTLQILTKNLTTGDNFYYYQADINIINQIKQVRINEYYSRMSSIIDIQTKNNLRFLLIGEFDNYLTVMVHKEKENGDFDFLFSYEYETYTILRFGNNLNDILNDNNIISVYDLNEEVEFYMLLKGII